MHHDLKIELAHYENVRSGDKPFEIRFNDRGYQRGDTFTLTPVHTTRYLPPEEYPPINATITYVTAFQQKEGWVVFGFRKDTTNEQ